MWMSYFLIRTRSRKQILCLHYLLPIDFYFFTGKKIEWWNWHHLSYFTNQWTLTTLYHRTWKSQTPNGLYTPLAAVSRGRKVSTPSTTAIDGANSDVCSLIANQWTGLILRGGRIWRQMIPEEPVAKFTFDDMENLLFEVIGSGQSRPWYGVLVRIELHPVVRARHMGAYLPLLFC
jgi:hypothetical protein